MTRRPARAWSAALEIAPELGALVARAGAVRDPGPPASFCRFVAWRPFKLRLWAVLEAHAGEIGADLWRVHDEALRRVLRALPPCRGCRCGKTDRALDREARRDAMRRSAVAGGRDHERDEP